MFHPSPPTLRLQEAAEYETKRVLRVSRRRVYGRAHVDTREIHALKESTWRQTHQLLFLGEPTVVKGVEAGTCELFKASSVG